MKPDSARNVPKAAARPRSPACDRFPTDLGASSSKGRQRPPYDFREGYRLIAWNDRMSVALLCAPDSFLTGEDRAAGWELHPIPSGLRPRLPASKGTKQ